MWALGNLFRWYKNSKLLKLDKRCWSHIIQWGNIKLFVREVLDVITVTMAAAEQSGKQELERKIT